MDKSIRVQVKEPCHENWQNMSPNEKGRFCGSCQKSVVDFTLMNDRQILDHLSKATGSTCGRFANDQLDRELKAEVIKPKSKWGYFINLLIPIFFSNSGRPLNDSNSTRGKSIMQNIKPDFQADKDYESRTVGVLIIYDSVSNENSVPKIEPDTYCPPAIAEPALQMEGEIDQDTLVHFNPPVIAFDDTTGFAVDTAMMESMKEIKEEQPCTIRLGGISYGVVIETNPVRSFIKDTLATIGIRKSVKAYPNPVIAGQSVTIDFNPKNLGTYNVELFDLNGKMIYSRQLNMVFEKQSFQVPTISTWSKGTYLIRITGEGKDNVNNVKVIVR